MKGRRRDMTHMTIEFEAVNTPTNSPYINLLITRSHNHDLERLNTSVLNQICLQRMTYNDLLRTRPKWQRAIGPARPFLIRHPVDDNNGRLGSCMIGEGGSRALCAAEGIAN